MEQSGGVIPVEVVPVKTTAPPPPPPSTTSSQTEPSDQTGDGAAPAVGPQGSGQQPESPAAPAVKPGETQDLDDGANVPEAGGSGSGGQSTEEPAGDDQWEPLPSVTTETSTDNTTTTPADGLSNMAAVESELLEMQYRDGR